ncbi:MAG: N-acetyl-gamma-glutamyl-phosphate reductase [Lautropia sp.]|nr:N-acetyl-gamma-glutamyl-phosphate reductase [Lautropia sp.]
MTYKVFVDGQEGTTGLQIHDYLKQRTDISVLRIDAALRKDPAERARLLNEADVAFLCLPDAAARESVALVENPATCVIDTSTAHRVSPDWVYGLPELEPAQRERIRQSKRIANPGCHASAFILALRPLVDAGLLPADWPVSATSLTGYSGGGKKMIEQYQGDSAAALQAPRPYALGLQHKHLPEMQRYTGLAEVPLFSPVVGPFYKGLAVSVPLDLGRLGGQASRQAVHQALAERYAGEAFVRVHSLDVEITDGFFDVQGSNDTNRVDLFVFGHDRQALLVARLDNLGKGASGAAVQSMNIHLGADEQTGLV